MARTTVCDGVRALVGAVCKRTVTRPTGKKDVDSAWAKARLAQAEQYKDQLGHSGMTTTHCGGGAACASLELQQIAWWDEKHAKCVLCPMGKMQWAFTVGPDLRFLSSEDGGKRFELPKGTEPHQVRARGSRTVG